MTLDLDIAAHDDAGRVARAMDGETTPSPGGDGRARARGDGGDGGVRASESGGDARSMRSGRRRERANASSLDAGEMSTTEDEDSACGSESSSAATGTTDGSESDDWDGSDADGGRRRSRRREHAGGDDDVVRAARTKRRKARKERERRRESGGEAKKAVTSKFAVCGTVFEVDAKYAPIKPVGKGAYGVVCSAREVETNRKVAIKKIVNVFENVVDAKRTLREIKLLRHLRHENVIDIIDCVRPKAMDAFEDVYLMYDLMDTDLYQIIRSSQSLTDEHCQYFLYQILRGLKYIHSADVLHRDLKPGNLLLNANCDLKICDFGLARTALVDAEASEFMTEYVVTRWYRAPELLLSCAEYTSAIDVWSVGCIFAELLGRKTLFPGKDYVHQLNLIMRVIGTPRDDSELDFINNEKARRYIKSLPVTARCNFRKLFPNASPKAVDLVDKMLVLDPARRITVEDALAHPYLESLHDEVDEPCAETPFTFNFEEDGRYLTGTDIRELIYTELCSLSDEFEVKMQQLSLRGGEGQ